MSFAPCRKADSSSSFQFELDLVRVLSNVSVVSVQNQLPLDKDIDVLNNSMPSSKLELKAFCNGQGFKRVDKTRHLECGFSMTLSQNLNISQPLHIRLERCVCDHLRSLSRDFPRVVSKDSASYMRNLCSSLSADVWRGPIMVFRHICCHGSGGILAILLCPFHHCLGGVPFSQDGRSSRGKWYLKEPPYGISVEVISSSFLEATRGIHDLSLSHSQKCPWSTGKFWGGGVLVTSMRNSTSASELPHIWPGMSGGSKGDHETARQLQGSHIVKAASNRDFNRFHWHSIGLVVHILDWANRDRFSQAIITPERRHYFASRPRIGIIVLN